MIKNLMSFLLLFFTVITGFGQSSDTQNLPSDGTYSYNIAFAEWGGRSMGEKVTVILKEGTIKILYDGEGELILKKKGEVIDEGKILKHKSGVWIIGKDEKDVDVEEVGGCSDGPNVIDFKEHKFWMC